MQCDAVADPGFYSEGNNLKGGEHHCLTFVMTQNTGNVGRSGNIRSFSAVGV